ncbi:hypothetical protein AB0F91_34215 [Amycolatopsis sp. NPDC023774]|uniref:hypothetical protein n=1 Tax=Amycolatopsis sp. NPDC023774 TaxID=3155015 RepID=UPI0033D76A63
MREDEVLAQLTTPLAAPAFPGGTIDELAKARDEKQIAVMRALGTTPEQEQR